MKTPCFIGLRHKIASVLQPKLGYSRALQEIQITPFEQRLEREKQMKFKKTSNKATLAVHCRKCRGRMTFEKFYGPNDSFYGWHCVFCGDILDPVILLHRLSQDANVSIPEKEEDILALMKKYMRAKPKLTATAK